MSGLIVNVFCLGAEIQGCRCLHLHQSSKALESKAKGVAVWCFISLCHRSHHECHVASWQAHPLPTAILALKAPCIWFALNLECWEAHPSSPGSWRSCGSRVLSAATWRTGRAPSGFINPDGGPCHRCRASQAAAGVVYRHQDEHVVNASGRRQAAAQVGPGEPEGGQVASQVGASRPQAGST